MTRITSGVFVDNELADHYKNKMEALEQENEMLMKFASQQPHFNAWVLKYRNEKKL